MGKRNKDKVRIVWRWIDFLFLFCVIYVCLSCLYSILRSTCHGAILHFQSVNYSAIAAKCALQGHVKHMSIITPTMEYVAIKSISAHSQKRIYC